MILARVLATCAIVAVAVGCDVSRVTDASGEKIGLAKPADQTIQRGKTNDVKISIERKDFNQPVTIEFDKLPSGVTVTEAKKEITADAESASFTLHAEPTADLVTNHPVTVTMKGPGVELTQSFRVTVEE